MSITVDSTDTQVFKFRVIALDVWGHGPGEHEEYDCKPNAHGEYTCDGYTVNAAYYTGRVVEVVAAKMLYNQGTAFASSEYHTTNEDVTRALVDAGEISPATKIDIDGEDDATLFVDLAGDDDPECGKPLLQLERVQ